MHIHILITVINKARRDTRRHLQGQSDESNNNGSNTNSNIRNR